MLSIKNISKAFGSKIVIDGISLNIEIGKIYALIGPNGSGKTTLFNIINQFVKADSGDILLNGKSLKVLKPYEICRLGIARSFQDLRLIGDLTVRENILLAFKNNKGEALWNCINPGKGVLNFDEKFRKNTEDIIKLTYLDDVSDQSADEISYGQQKLVNLACCIAGEAELFLLDEPVAGINPYYREEIKKIILNLKNQGKTFILIEHNPDFIKQLCDRILFLDKGRIKIFNNYESFKLDEEVIEAYLN